MPETRRKVGFIGLGIMGSRMAGNLVAAGHDVTVWNHTPGPVEALRSQGASVAASPAELGAGCDYVTTSLPNGAVVEEVLFGENGAMTAARPGTIAIDHSTISPSDARHLADRCESISCEFVDAPVGGGPEGAEAGTLAVFIGGRDSAVAAARPVIAAYAATIVHLGPPGSGQVAKLANQICCAANQLGLSEAFAYATAEGIDPAKLYEILAAAGADSRMLRSRVPVPGIQPQMPASNKWKPGFTADFMVKDLKLAVADSVGVGVTLRTAELVLKLLAGAQQDGHGKDDWTIFCKYL